MSKDQKTKSRWETTATAAMYAIEENADAVKNMVNENRELRKRNARSETSINFGNEKVTLR